ncbi:hypothetical protein MEO41_28125, partial [Dolichospermum sp. ST_sed4]|nr:hypothetical protein [Dolichospermum sp. ST_sed4]
IRFMSINGSIKNNFKKELMSLLLISFLIFAANHCYAVSVGDSCGGGTVFCVSQTADISQCVTTGSGCAGLIMANTDQVNYYSNPNHGVSWSSVYSTTGTISFDDGATNTATIIAALPSDNSSNNAAREAHKFLAYQD